MRMPGLHVRALGCSGARLIMKKACATTRPPPVSTVPELPSADSAVAAVYAEWYE